MITMGFNDDHRECAVCRERIAFGSGIDYNERGQVVHVICPRDEAEED